MVGHDDERENRRGDLREARKLLDELEGEDRDILERWIKSQEKVMYEESESW